jgi:histidinol dehydrogenase
VVNPALLYALDYAGATEIYKVGGAQAVAALAYGTKSIAPVLKIYGPGNAYVVEAKRQVFGRVAVDLLPGPSEILIIADKTANPAWIAADMLAQAEHGHGSGVGVVTDSAKILTAVQNEVKRQAALLSRQQHLLEVLEKNTFLVLVKNLVDAVKIANDFAPEHLSIVAKDEEKLATDIRTSGAIFIGGLSPVVGGDFLAGPSHELPTGGAGKSFPGLTVDQFQRRTSIVRFDKKSLKKSLPFIQTFSDIEGLDAHGHSAAIRFEE